MLWFAWLTLCTGLILSGIAAFYSVTGLALVFAGAYWPVVILAGTLEIAKLIATTWLYRYRHLASRGVRVYFYTATITLMLITSLGIFGFLTRAHVETEGIVAAATLSLDAVKAKESQLLFEREQLTNELSALNQQSSQLVAQLGAAQRLRGTQGAIAIQRETATRRAALLDELKVLNTQLSNVQQERIVSETTTNTATADIGPLRYVAQSVYGKDDMDTIRRAVVTLTVLLMLVFDPMAIMLLIAANILFSHSAQQAHTTTPVTPQRPLSRTTPRVSAPALTVHATTPKTSTPTMGPFDEPTAPHVSSTSSVLTAPLNESRVDDIPTPLRPTSRSKHINSYLARESQKIITS